MKSPARSTTQIGAILHRERRARGLTQAQLGAKTGLRQATVSKLEKGEPATRLSTLFDVLAALNLELTVTSRGKTSPKDIGDLF
jgi:HTH-type transcriptional regulator/antitoxin HipB